MLAWHVSPVDIWSAEANPDHDESWWLFARRRNRLCLRSEDEVAPN